MISTIYGEQDEATLIKKSGVVETDTEYTTWVEYHNATGELVHRSAHVTIKQGLIAGAMAGQPGG